jgi:tetratricopeptide (TPR) repeat protein
MSIRLRLTLAALASSLVWLTPLPYYTPPQPVFAQTQPDLAEAERLNQQVLELYKQGRYSEAIPLAQKALTLREKSLGAEHSSVAQSLNNLASLYSAQSQYAKAELLYQRSLAIREKTLGAEHPNAGNPVGRPVCLRNRVR